MQFADWLNLWWSHRKPARRRSRHGKQERDGTTRAKVAAELLEQRMLPAVITVTSLADTVANDGQVTLREAIQAANTDSVVDGSTQGNGADTIQFAPSLTAGGPATITLGGTQLAISSDLTISGSGADRLTINGDSRSRLFLVDDGVGTTKKTVTISDLTLAGGAVQDTTSGGAILSKEKLTITNCVITGNTARDGGGVASGHGELTIHQSVISRNFASFGGGGGIFHGYGPLTIRQSTISGNSNFNGAGGGICSYGATGEVTIAQSTIAGNSTSHGSGGGARISRTNGPVTITQSTISGNTSDSVGGLDVGGFTSFTIAQSTVVGNSALSDAGGLRTDLSNLTLTNTIIAGNTLADGTPHDMVGGTLTSSAKNNLIGDPAHAGGLSHGVNGNIVGQSNGAGGRTTLNLATVLFVAPMNIGGQVTAIPILAGSPALNAGANSAIPLDSFDLDGDGNKTETVPFDQNGSGFNRVVDGTVDIGAFEGIATTTVVAVAAIPAKLKEDGSENLVFRFSRSNTIGSLTVNFAVGGSAAQNSDYTTSDFSGSTGFVTFDDGSSVASVTVDPMADGLFEDNESVALTITSDPSYTISSWNSAVGTIANDDTIVVDTLEDAVDGNRTPGDWSLREAILLANSNAGPDTIVFAPSLTSIGPATISLTLGLIRINDDLVIQGPTDRGLTISGNNTFQLFEVEDRTSADKVVAFRSLTLTGGKAEISGGAISNGENLTISDCTITGNFAFIEGGGINNGNRARLTVEQSTLTGNSANFRGGAIANRGTALTIRQSTIVGNSVVGGSPGGGVFDYYRTAELTNTIIAGNTKGSGLESDFEGSTLTSASRNNLIGSPTTAGGLTHGTNGNIVGQANGSGRTRLNLASVLSATLADNGGPTKSLALASGSPAIDAGNNGLIPADTSDSNRDGNTTEAAPSDQRGSGFARLQNGTVDIGAVEFPSVVSPISIAATSAFSSEGNGSNTEFGFTVTRTGVTSGAASVDYRVTGIGTNAADAADFGGTLPSGTVNFAANETSQTLIFHVSGDSTAETDDSFVVRLLNPVGGFLDTASTNLVINGDFEAGNTSFSSAHRNRPNTLDSLHAAGDYTITTDPRFVHDQFASYPDHTPGSGTFMLVANGATTPITIWGQTVAVSPNTTYQFAAYGSTTVVDTASLRFEINGVDVGTLNVPAVTGLWTPFSATWNSGNATTADLKIINLSVASNGNDFALDDISFGATTGTPAAVGIILNDDINDASLSIAASNASRLEGNSGTTASTFTVTRTGDTSGTASANFAVTGSGTNLANAADFGGSLPSGMIRFEAGESSKTLTINASGDTTVEPNEGFTVTLSNLVGASLGAAAATGTIRNDDSALSIAGTSASNSEGNSGTTPFTFTVTRTGTISGTASVDYAVTGSGTNAADAADFGGSLPSGTINFAAGETSKSITINVNGDSVGEFNENFAVTLSNPTADNVVTASATGAILNDDWNVSLDAFGNLRIRDLAAGGRADQLTVSFDAASQEIVIRDSQNTLTSSIGTIVSTQEIRVTRAAITGNGLRVELNGQADQLDLSGLPAGLLSVEVDGGDGNDTVIGHAGADLILGGRGNDSISAGAGHDTLSGGDGNDVLRGEAGHDVLRGQMNNDRLIGGDGDDTCDGGGGDDILSGDAGYDSLLGSTGNDVLSGGDGRDKILGGDGHDRLEGNSGNDQLNGGLGNDSVDGGAGNDFIEGQAGNDLINGGAGDDTLQGGFDDDTLIGLSGHDRLEGGDGNDLAKGGDGNDTLLGGSGNDNLSGSIGDDVEDGGEGADTLAGGDGNDSLAGGEGNDYLHGDNGLDDLHGDAGDDSLDGGAGQDVISGDLGDDILVNDEDDELL